MYIYTDMYISLSLYIHIYIYPHGSPIPFSKGWFDHMEADYWSFAP